MTYLQFWKKWRDYSGTTSRAHFWEIVAINVVITLMIAILWTTYLMNMVFGADRTIGWIKPVTYWPVLAWIIITFIPSMALLSRRFNDVGYSHTACIVINTIDITITCFDLFIIVWLLTNEKVTNWADLNQLGIIINKLYEWLFIVGSVVTFYATLIAVAPKDFVYKIRHKH